MAAWQQREEQARAGKQAVAGRQQREEQARARGTHGPQFINSGPLHDLALISLALLFLSPALPPQLDDCQPASAQDRLRSKG